MDFSSPLPSASPVMSSSTPTQQPQQSTPTGAKQPLLTLDQSEERILHLLTLASTVTSALSEVHPDAVNDVQIATREFYASLRLIYASLLAQIRLHAPELQHLGGPTPLAAAHPAAAAAQAQAASIAAAAHEYRRNVYLDTQAMQVAMENINIQKERILDMQQQLQQQQQQGSGANAQLDHATRR